jgi:pimeloyl-ACP methyl ester carboxylesterase
MAMYLPHLRLDLLTLDKNWLNTPDGREGFASFFLRQGYVVYLTDQPERGRSIYTPGSGQLVVLSTTTISSYFTAPEKVVPLPYPQAANHTQWPGTGLPGDPAFDALFASQVQFQGNNTITAQLANHSYIALAEHIGTPHILVTHSQGGPFGFQLANERPDLVAGLVSIEPGASPFESWTGPPYAPGYAPAWPPLLYGLTALPLVYDPPLLPDDDPSALARETHPPAGPNLSPCILQAEPARKLPNLAKVPMLQMVGEASFQAVYSGCVASYLEQAGVDVEFVRLEERGIRGNGHFMFMEKNSIEVAEKVVMPFLEKLEKQ